MARQHTFRLLLGLSRGSRVSGEDILEVTGGRGHGPGPVTEAAMRVDGVNPFIEKLAFGAVLIAVAASRAASSMWRKRISSSFRIMNFCRVEHSLAEIGAEILWCS